MPRIIDVVQFLDESGQEIVHREPEGGPGDFRLGSQVIVRESQTAVFFATASLWMCSAPAATR